jgi:hypothetical protein
MFRVPRATAEEISDSIEQSSSNDSLALMSPCTHSHQRTPTQLGGLLAYGGTTVRNMGRATPPSAG